MTQAWRFPDARLLVFAKAPTPGYVKTRLIPTLTPQQAASLHTRLVKQSLHTATHAKLCPIELWCSPNTHETFFADCAQHYGVSLQQQQGEDLGARMAHALASSLSETRCAVLIGTDCPPLNADDLAEALDALSTSHDAVLGPAEDGGYYLIGLRQAVPELFENIPWGSNEVLHSTTVRMESLGLRWHTLRLLWDLDRPEDLQRMVAE